ncbi:MAG: PE family protein [Mycobacterium sp.]
MVALQADTAGLHAVAAGLRAAAHSLAQLGAKPLAHPPLGADETSMSAAARLSEHGSVMASRAVDGAAVLESAAEAISQAAQTYTAMDIANAAVVSLQGNPAPPTPAPTPAVTVDLTAADIPIAPLAPRPAEATAAIMEAGQPNAGAPFVSGCTALSGAFEQGARSARTAAAAVSELLHGDAGPRISAALNRYADWSDSMTRYADSLGSMADDHKDRFAQAQHNTPTTTDFTNRHRQLQNAIAVYSSRPTPGAAAAVSQAHSNVTVLTNRTHIVATGYHTGELPATPPGPPPVVPIVEPGGGQGDNPATMPQDGPPQAQAQAQAGRVPTDSDDGDDITADDGDDLLTGTDDPAAGPLGATGMSGMASSLPAMMTGLVGGLVGMAASIPEKLGQEVQQVAQQATQAVTGLASGLAGKDQLDDAVDSSLGDGFTGSGGGELGGGGGGETTPAGEGGTGDLKPAASAMGSVEPSAPPLAGYRAAPSAPTAAAGMGGAPMFMPPMGAGMGGGTGGATRNIKDPDKSIVTPSRPNSEPVKGERRDPVRHTATVDPAALPPKTAAKRTVTVRSRTRRTEQPDGEGDAE